MPDGGGVVVLTVYCCSTCAEKASRLQASIERQLRALSALSTEMLRQALLSGKVASGAVDVTTLPPVRLR